MELILGIAEYAQILELAGSGWASVAHSWSSLDWILFHWFWYHLDWLTELAFQFGLWSSQEQFCNYGTGCH